ncbi:hypothetical protein [Agriterribacter sp.]|uniref:hypothetical protein n=1 Tax=Agriterribacter sp. TaxID=2821509 RepID=UPI002C3B4906|nr:hypothetical protein [Agriterribacter sp.]HRP58343.1 hypothetical protein [Agriterribacter sp.]
MGDKAMLFENLVLSAWGNGFRRTDPFQLGDADTFRLLRNDLQNREGHEAKFALSTAIMKTAAENEEAKEKLIVLDKKLWNIKLPPAKQVDLWVKP